MCGLVGVLGGHLADKHRKAFKEMFWASALRGYDSSGIIQVTAEYGKGTKINPKDVTYKAACPSPWLIATKEFNTLSSDKETRAILGHCRARTIGENKHENAHPFSFDKVVGMHNGTLSGKYPYKFDYETDSESLYRSINDHGIEETISDLDGAWALSWFNREENTINFIRNKERELWFANEKFTDVLFWASEPGILYWILARNGIDYESVVKLAPDTLISFNILDYVPSKSITRKLNIKRKERAPSKSSIPFLEKPILPIVSVAKILGPDGARSVTHGSHKAKNVPSVISKLPRTSEPGTNSVYFGYNKKEFTLSALKETLAYGCVYCAHKPAVGEAVRWINENDFFCKFCKDVYSFDFKVKPQIVCH